MPLSAVFTGNTKGGQPNRKLIVSLFLSQTMADKFQKEISVVMRGELSIRSFFFKRAPPAVSPFVIVLIVHFKDKLTAELPVLRSQEEGAPLPKVAAHVTGGGVGSFTEPPPADGEGVWKVNV